MVGDDLGQIRRLGAFGNDRGGVRYMLEQRSVRKERAACDKDNPRVRLPVAYEIRCRDCAPVLKHHIQNHDLGGIVMQEIDGRLLACDDVHAVVLPF